MSLDTLLAICNLPVLPVVGRPGLVLSVHGNLARRLLMRVHLPLHVGVGPVRRVGVVAHGHRVHVGRRHAWRACSLSDVVVLTVTGVGSVPVPGLLKGRQGRRRHHGLALDMRMSMSMSVAKAMVVHVPVPVPVSVDGGPLLDRSAVASASMVDLLRESRPIASHRHRSIGVPVHLRRHIPHARQTRQGHVRRDHGWQRPARLDGAKQLLALVLEVGRRTLQGSARPFGSWVGAGQPRCRPRSARDRRAYARRECDARRASGRAGWRRRQWYASVLAARLT